MSGIGDFAATLRVSTTDWRDGFAEANSVLDNFASRFDSTMANVAQRSHEIGVVARTAALSVGALGLGLKVVGGGASGLFRVAGALSGVALVAGNLSVALKNLRSGSTFTQKIVGSLGAVGAGAGAATLALKGLSLVLARMGKDTVKVDALAKSLGRVATAATIAVLGIQAVSLSLRAMRGAASLSIGAATAGFRGLQAVVLAVPKGIMGVASAMRRVGSAGVGMLRSGAASAGQFAAAAGDKLSQLGQNIASVATGFAFGGIIGGLATTIGLLVQAGVSMESFGAVSRVVSNVVAELSARWQKYSAAFLQAIQPMVDAIQNVWLPAIRGSTEGAGNAFTRFFDYIEGAWGGWLYDSINALAEFVGNFDLYFQIAQQAIVLWASNSILQVGDFFKNIGTWLDWFGQNWSDVLFTAFDLASTVFINIGQNIRDIFSKIWEWVKSGFTGDLDIDWTPLTEGFRSTIKKLPELTKTELAETTPELENLYSKLGQRQAEAAKRIREKAAAGEATPESTAIKPAPGLKAALAGTQEAAQIMLRGVGGGKSMEQIAQKQLAVQQQTLVAVKANKPPALMPLSL